MRKFLVMTAAVALVSGCATTSEQDRDRRYGEPAYAPQYYCNPAQQNCAPTSYCPPGQSCQPNGYAYGFYGPSAAYAPPEQYGRGDRGESEGPQRPREQHGVEAAPARPSDHRTPEGQGHQEGHDGDHD